MPDAFQPPNGRSTAASAVEQLILRMPALARRRKSSLSFAELEDSAAAKPCSTQLQSQVASSQSFARCTTSTGPKLSSCTISWAGSSQQIIAGGSYTSRGGVCDFCKGRITDSDDFFARSIIPATRVHDADEIKCPICVCSLVGSPQVSLALAATSSSRKRSYTLVSTIARRFAVQRWPAKTKAPSAMLAAAPGRSASRQTILALLPLRSACD